MTEQEKAIQNRLNHQNRFHQMIEGLKFTADELQEEEEADDGLMLSLFLDFLTKDALKNSDRLEAYTEEMSQEDDELLAGVEIDP